MTRAASAKTTSPKRARAPAAAVLARVFEHAEAGLACTDADGLLTHVNPGFERAIGTPAAALIGTPLASLTSSDSGTEVPARIAALLRGESAELRLELRRDLDDDRELWTDFSVRATRDDAGAVIGLIATAIDVTEAKRREALQLQHQALAMQNAGLGLWRWAPLTGAMTFDMLWAMSLGYAVSGLAPVVATWNDRVHPDDADAVNAAVLACLKGHAAEFAIEHRMRHQAGHWVWLFSTGMVTQRDADGQALQVVGTSQDITQRKTAEAALVMSQLRQTLAMQTAGLGQWERHVPSDEASFDARICEMLGYAPGELQPHLSTFRKIGFAEDQAAIAAEIEPLLRGDVDEYRIVRRRRHKLGHTIWVLDTGRVVERDANGRALRMVGLYQDITEQRQLETTLREAKEVADAASRSKSEFLANMSHEIRTPLNAVIGLTRLVLDTQLTSRQHDYLAKVHSASKSLLGILNDVLDYSKIEAGRMELEHIQFSIEEPLNSVANLFGAQIEQKGLELFFEMAPDMPMEVIGDPLRLTQVLNNLVGNAIKFTERGEIRVKAELASSDGEHRMLRIAVSDTGIGLSKEQAGRLFQAFTQADNSVTRKYGGTGLGLTISQKLVDLMEGEIAVSSVQGEGCTFAFTFKVRVPASQPDALDLQRLSGLRALVVDDQETSRMIMENMFSAWGMTVDITPSPIEGLRLVRERQDSGTPYDVVLLDWRMPEMNGLDVARKMREQTGAGHCPPFAVMVTAFGREQLLAEATDLALEVVLTKPIVPSALFNILTRLKQGAGVAKPAPAPEATAVRFDGARILLAEDNALNQIVACEFLKGYGAVVEIANDGLEAVELARAHSFDMVLMDLHMPNLDGIGAARAVRALPGREQLPIVAMTAAVMSEDRGRCEEAGMVDFVAKPVDPDDLVRAMRRWLPGASADRQPAARAPIAVEEVVASTSIYALKLNGFDPAAALRRMRGNEERLIQLLRSFASQQQETLAQVRAALAAENRAGAIQELHSIKGVAGTLGLMALADAADALEAQIKASAPTDDVPFATELEHALAALRNLVPGTNALAPAAAEPAAAPPGPTGPQRDALHRMLSDLARYVREQELIPDELLDEFKRLSVGAWPAQPVALLCQHIFDFDHDAALSDLQHLASSIDVALPA